MKSWANRTVTLVLVCMTGALVAAPAQAARDLPSASQVQQVTDQAVDAWSAYQQPDGSIADGGPQNRPVGYGLSMFSYAQLRSGLRRGDAAMVSRALSAARLQAQRNNRTPFDLWALAALYEYAEQHLTEDTEWAQTRETLRAYFAAQTTARPLNGGSGCSAQNDCYSNWDLIFAAALARMQRLGLAPQGANEQIGRTLQRAARAAGPQASSGLVSGGLSVLSDPTHHQPLAYHWMSLVQLLDLRASGISDAWLDQQIRASLNYGLAAAAPNGNLSYYGRSNQQVWVSAASLLVAAREQNVRPQSMRALGGYAFANLNGYRLGDGRLALTPAMLRTWSYRGVDSYAGMGVYNGLTLFLLTQAADLLGQAPLGGAALPSQRPGGMRDLRGSGLITRTSAGWWFALQTQARQPGRALDLRLQTGLIAAQRRIGKSWVSALPAPSLCRDVAPLTLRRSGRTLYPHWTRAVNVPGGLLLRGWWVSARGVRLFAAEQRIMVQRGRLLQRTEGRARWRLTGFWHLAPSSRVRVGTRSWKAASDCASASHPRLRRLGFQAAAGADQTSVLRAG